MILKRIDSAMLNDWKNRLIEAGFADPDKEIDYVIRELADKINSVRLKATDIGYLILLIFPETEYEVRIGTSIEKGILPKRAYLEASIEFFGGRKAVFKRIICKPFFQLVIR